MDSPPGARTVINGRWRDYFSGTGYLGLQTHPDLLAAAGNALTRFGLTTATSRGGYGEHPLFAAVEEAAARFWATESAIYYVSGYLGTFLILQGLADDYDCILVDEASHFSVWDAARCTGKPVHPFHHLAADALIVALRGLRPGARPLVLSDGVFPISGEIAPLPDYLTALREYPGAVVCLDDAHGSGVLGKHGRGTLEHWRDDGAVGAPGRPVAPDVRIYSAHTLSKAIGGHGGLIAADAAVVRRLNAIPTPGAASPTPLPAAAASAWALAYLHDHPERRLRLRENVTHARAALRGLGWDLPESPVPILCLHGGNWRGGAAAPDLAHIQRELFERDICVAHVTRYSSTPPGGALRVAIFATHRADQIDRLVTELASLLG
jgi:glycine C-acetyltransferase/8-amino-7-oxononanoate synthase